MDGMVIDLDERVYMLAEAIVWPMSEHTLRLELSERMANELSALPIAELEEMLRDYSIPAYVGDNQC